MWRTLCNRSRYALANSSCAGGGVLTPADDWVSTGPRLHLPTGDGETSRTVEKSFDDWVRGIRLAETLRTMRLRKAIDGEAFCVLTVSAKFQEQWPPRAGRGSSFAVAAATWSMTRPGFFVPVPGLGKHGHAVA